MYKVIKYEEFYFDTLKEALKKKDTDFGWDDNVNIMEVDDDKETLVMEGEFFDYQWFRNFVDDFKGNIYIRSYHNPVSVKILHDRIELLTNDEDEELNGGSMIRKGKHIFKIDENSGIKLLNYDKYRILTDGFAFDVSFGGNI